MSDEDERQTKSNTSSFYEINNRRLSAIRIKLQELTRDKTKYNVEKLIQDIEFLQGELGHLSHMIADLNKEINAQIYIKLNLNAKIAILRSNSGIRYPNLETAISYKERFEKELEKPMKSEVYRDLARRKIKSINEALPQLEIQDEYNQKLQQAEDRQIAAQDKREKFQEILNTKSRKQAELRQLLNDSTTKLPELETGISNLRLERDEILTTMNDKKQRHRSFTIQPKPLDPPVKVFATLEQDTLDYEKQHATKQLEKIRTLLNYFHGKMAEHNLPINEQPSSELSSPLYQSITPLEEQTILSSYMNEDKSSSTNESTVAIAMKLPRNLTPADINSTTNEIIHSPYHPESSIEYKKELPSDILDKYAGTTNKKQQQSGSGKKNKKNKKNFGMKHSSQMIVLYNDVRTSSGNSDTLPYMPLYEYELSPTVKALQLLEQSVQSYLNELSKRELYHLPNLTDEQQQDNEIVEDDDIRDSALDTFSETSSLIETINISKDSASAIPQLMNIPEARSSSSSDDKKTVVSSASPPSSHHSHSKSEHQSPLTTVEELPPYLPPLAIEIAQMERQISDEGYRSVRNEKQQQQATGNNSPLLIRSNSYDCTEKVDKWLSSTTPPLALSMTDENFNSNNHNTTDFRPTDIDNTEENLVESTIPVSNN
jgi:hypothetical protein